MNGGLCSAFDDRRERRQLERRAPPVRPSSSSSGSASAAAPRRRARRVWSSSANDRSSPPSSSSTSRCTSRSRRLGSAPCTSVIVTTPPLPHRGEQRLDRAADPRGCPARRARARCGNPCVDAVRDGRERLGPAVVDLAPEQLADEALVRRREQQRVAELRVHRRSRAAAPRSAPASCRGRAPRRARSARGSRPAASARRAPLEQERGDVGDEVVVVRDSGSGTRGRSRMCVATTVASCSRRDRAGSRDRRSRRCRCRRPRPPRTRRRAPTRARCRSRAARRSVRAAPRSAGTTRSSSSASPTSGPGPAFTPPTSRRSAPAVDELLGAAEERVEVPGRAAVVERVGRAVEDAHHERHGVRTS